MTIITWNCNMAFRRKANIILAYKPDVLVIQECEHPSKINFTQHSQQPTTIIWVGDNNNKGLGIFLYNGFTGTLHKNYTNNIKYVAPISIKHNTKRFTLFAIWANNPADKDGAYVTQIWKALANYKKLIRKTNTILTGDFNSNTIWDRPRREGNHSTVVKTLAKKSIGSTYHTFYNQIQGKEADATWFLHRNHKKPYHLDYCFAASNMLQHLKQVQVGNYKHWLQFSDHMPVISTFNISLD
jgi:exodeoxyribonuclease III